MTHLVLKELGSLQEPGSNLAEPTSLIGITLVTLARVLAVTA